MPTEKTLWTLPADGRSSSLDRRFQIRTYVDSICPSRPGGKGKPSIFFVIEAATGVSEWTLSMADARRWAEAHAAKVTS